MLFYHLPHTVDSNDSLYAGGKKFVGEVAKLVHTLLEQILEHMKSLTTSDEVRGLSLWLESVASLVVCL